MADIRPRFFCEVVFYRIPFPIIVSDAFAVGANGDHSSQGLDLLQIIRQSFVSIAKHLIHMNNFEV